LILNVARTRGIATSRSTSSGARKASRPATRGGSARAAKLRAVEGGGNREQSRRTASAKRRSSSGRNRGSRGSGARRRRRAAS
jgi:hypothetical protein